MKNVILDFKTITLLAVPNLLIIAAHVAGFLSIRHSSMTSRAITEIAPVFITSYLSNTLTLNVAMYGLLRRPGWRFSASAVQDRWGLQVVIHATNRTPRALEIIAVDSLYFNAALQSEAQELTIPPNTGCDIAFQLSPIDEPPTAATQQQMSRERWILLKISSRYQGHRRVKTSHVRIDNPFRSFSKGTRR